MRKIRRWMAVGWAVAGIGLAAASQGAAQEGALRSFPIEGPALDLAVSPDGEWIYVLTAEGQVLVYTREGTLKNRLEVGVGHNAIAAGPAEGSIYLSRGDEGRVSALAVTLQHDFDFRRSPARGPADAPVVLAVFSDFQ